MGRVSAHDGISCSRESRSRMQAGYDASRRTPPKTASSARLRKIPWGFVQRPYADLQVERRLKFLCPDRLEELYSDCLDRPMQRADHQTVKDE